MQPSNNLSWTGERFIPGVQLDTMLEHLHRYALAQHLATDMRVLDVACGEGYGSSLLAEKAISVIGIDLDDTAVNHARTKYQSPNLEFLQGNCTALPLEDGSIDLAVSFETLEHHSDHEAMLTELRRVLTPEGILLLSTPDRLHYSDERDYRNPFHTKELYAEEFHKLVFRYFPNAVFYGQRVVYASLAAPVNGINSFVSYTGDCAKIEQSSGLSMPFYWIAIASAGPLPALPTSLFDGTKTWQDVTSALLQELAATKDQLARTRLQLDSVYASIYWRLTSPLRILRRWSKQILGI